MTLAPVTNMRAAVAHQAGLLGLGADHDAGRIAKMTIGMSKASQSCMKRAALSEPSLSMAPPSVHGLLATTPTGRPSMRMKAVTMVRPKSRPQLEHRVLVGERLDDLAHVVDAQAVLGNDRGAAALVGAVQFGNRPWK